MWAVLLIRIVISPQKSCNRDERSIFPSRSALFFLLNVNKTKEQVGRSSQSRFSTQIKSEGRRLVTSQQHRYSLQQTQRGERGASNVKDSIFHQVAMARVAAK